MIIVAYQINESQVLPSSSIRITPNVEFLRLRALLHQCRIVHVDVYVEAEYRKVIKGSDGHLRQRSPHGSRQAFARHLLCVSGVLVLLLVRNRDLAFVVIAIRILARDRRSAQPKCKKERSSRQKRTTYTYLFISIPDIFSFPPPPPPPPPTLVVLRARKCCVPFFYLPTRSTYHRAEAFFSYLLPFSLTVRSYESNYSIFTLHHSFTV